MRIDPSEGRELPEPEVALLAAGAEEEVAAQELVVEDTRGTSHHLTTALVTEVTRLLELFEVEGIVDVDDHYLLRLAEEREHRQQEALEEQDVAPILQLPHLLLVDAANGETLVADVACLQRHQLDVVLVGQSFGDLPRPDGRARHLGGEGVAGGDHDATPAAQKLAQTKGVDDGLHGRREVTAAVGLERQAEESHDLAVGSLAGLLQRPPGGGEASHRLDQSVDRVGRGERLPRDVEPLVVVGSR